MKLIANEPIKPRLSIAEKKEVNHSSDSSQPSPDPHQQAIRDESHVSDDRSSTDLNQPNMGDGIRLTGDNSTISQLMHTRQTPVLLKDLLLLQSSCEESFSS